MKALLALIALPLLAASPVNDPSREARWQEDLRFFAQQFPALHVDFLKLYARAAFDAEMAALESGIPKLADAEIVLRLTRLVASANVDHTFVPLPIFKLGFQQVPLTLHWYSDGLGVAAATPDYAAALGARVLRIGSMTPQQLLVAVTPYIPHENETGLRRSSHDYLESLQALQTIGATGPDRKVVFSLVRPGGEPFTLTVTPGDARVTQVNALDELHVSALYRKHPDSYYWYEYLADSRALYIQYNRCKNDPQLSFKEFARGLFDFADAHPVDRVVVDLRFNPGGDSSVIDPLINGLKSRSALRSHVYGLIGPITASSGQWDAIELRNKLHAPLIGEPTPERLNLYGEVRILTLPNSQLKIRYSTRYFRLVKDSEASSLDPDIPVPFSLEDALAGRDPALDAALRHPQ